VNRIFHALFAQEAKEHSQEVRAFLGAELRLGLGLGLGLGFGVRVRVRVRFRVRVRVRVRVRPLSPPARVKE